MTDFDDDEDDARAKRKRLALSNGAVIGFLRRQWMRSPVAFWVSIVLTLAGVLLHLCGRRDGWWRRPPIRLRSPTSVSWPFGSLMMTSCARARRAAASISLYETSGRVAQATEALIAGRTTIVIAHRLSTVRGTDRILVFQNGRIVQEGRHGDLIAGGGVYAHLTEIANA